MAAARDLKTGDVVTLEITMTIDDTMTSKDGKRVWIRTTVEDSASLAFGGATILFECKPGRTFHPHRAYNYAGDADDAGVEAAAS